LGPIADFDHTYAHFKIEGHQIRIMGKAETKSRKDAQKEKDVSKKNDSNEIIAKENSNADTITKSNDLPEKAKSKCTCMNFSLLLMFIGVSAGVASVIIAAVRLDVENKSLRKEITSSNKDLQAIKVVKNKLESELKSTKTQLKEAKENASKLTSKVSLLEVESEKLQEKLDITLGEHSEQNKELNKRSDKIVDLENHVVSLKETESELRVSIKSLEEGLQASVDQLTAMSSSNNELNTQVSEKSSAISQLEIEIEHVSKILEEERAFHKSIADTLQVNMETLEVKKKELVDLTLLKDNSVNALEQVNRQIDQLTANNLELESANKELTVSLEESKLVFNEEKAKNELIDSELTTCQTEIEQKMKENIILQSEKESLNANMLEVRKTNEQQLNLMQDTKAELDAKVSLMEGELKECSDVSERIITIESTNKALTDSNNQLKTEKELVIQESMTLQVDLNDKKTKLRELENNLLMAQSDAGKCIVDHNNAIQNLESMKAEKDQIEGEKSALESQKNIIAEENNVLKSTVDRIDSEKNSLENEKNGLMEEILNLKSTVENNANDKKSIIAELEKERNEKSDLSNKMIQLQTDCAATGN